MGFEIGSMSLRLNSETEKPLRDCAMHSSTVSARSRAGTPGGSGWGEESVMRHRVNQFDLWPGKRTAGQPRALFSLLDANSNRLRMKLLTAE